MHLDVIQEHSQGIELSFRSISKEKSWSELSNSSNFQGPFGVEGVGYNSISLSRRDSFKINRKLSGSIAVDIRKDASSPHGLIKIKHDFPLSHYILEFYFLLTIEHWRCSYSRNAPNAYKLATSPGCTLLTKFTF